MAYVDKEGYRKLWNRAKSYTDTQLKTITDNLTAEVVCAHSYEITGNTGDEHGLAVEDQQMIIKKIEGQTKVVKGNLVNSNCVLKSSGRNLIDITKPKELSPEFTIVNNNTITVDGSGDWALNYYYKDNFVVYSPLNQLTKITSSIDELRLINGNGIIYNLPVLSNITIGLFADISSNQKTISNIRVVIKDTPYEPFKEDVIEGIGELGQYDYDDLIAQKGIRQTSDIVTLNGSEDWQEITDQEGTNTKLFRIALSNGTDSYYFPPINSTLFAQEDGWTNDINCYYAVNGSLYFRIEKKLAADLNGFKNYLRANPIQLVYKKATPTKVDVNLPSGYAVYNGGLQSQVGDVPYKITKQYNLSQKAQILANVEIDREQQALIDNTYNKAEVDSKVPTITFENGVLNIITSNK